MWDNREGSEKPVCYTISWMQKMAEVSGPTTLCSLEAMSVVTLAAAAIVSGTRCFSVSRIDTLISWRYHGIPESRIKAKFNCWSFVRSLVW